jgi:aspartokinase-like uncharacterized kinase
MPGFADAVVVKLGGSLLEAAEGVVPPIDPLLAAIGRRTGPVIVVPGGGAFADVVRSEQRRLGLSDAVAHTMALHAMAQAGLALIDRAPAGHRLVALHDPAHMQAILAQGFVPVWNPIPFARRAEHLGTDWRVTSDSLAAWLAITLGCRSVVLVKSCGIPEDATADDLSKAGIVDDAFPAIVAKGSVPWQVVHHADRDGLRRALGGAAAKG